MDQREEIYRFIASHFTPENFFWVLADSFNRLEILELLRGLGVTYQGVRISSLPEEKLLSDLADDFFKNPGIASLIIAALLKKNEGFAAGFQKISPEELEQFLNKGKDIAKLGLPGLVIWALLVDERPERRDLSLKIVKKLRDYLARQGKKMAKKFEKAREIEAFLSPLEDELASLKNELKKSQKTEKKQQARIIELEKETASLRRAKESWEQERNQLRQRGEFYRRDSERLVKILGEVDTLIKTKIVLEEKIAALGGENLALQQALLKEKDKRLSGVGLFVDAQNLYYGAKELYGGQLDFQVLYQKLTRERRVVKAVAYVVRHPESPQQNFIDYLKNIGYEVKVRIPKVHFDGSVKGDWDIGLALDALSVIDKIDILVLVSGDGDFVDLIKNYQARGLKVEVAAFPPHTSQDLRNIADKYYPLDESFILKTNM